ncbi:hypothetical protein CD351_00860 [Erythrobacter sp. KY5]|nr:hypothetical protein CD351_00860 [Erythrobacter sp. KY5]
MPEREQKGADTMTKYERPNDLLLLAGKVLTVIGQIGLAIGGLALTIAIPLFLFFGDEISAEIAEQGTTAIGPFPTFAMLAFIVTVLFAMFLAFLFFGKLRAIISSVGEGDPFVPENAERLNIMAWLMLGIQVLLIPAAGFGLMLAKWADEMEHAEFTIDVGLDLTGILMVIVLFILARVFKHGAAMREDLEGTV